jgi:hypothetical protein
LRALARIFYRNAWNGRADVTWETMEVVQQPQSRRASLPGEKFHRLDAGVTVRGRLLQTGLAILFLVFAGGELAQSGDVSREYHLKSAFLCQFAQYVDWPEPAFESPESPIVFAILGEDPFGTILEEIAQHHRINGRAPKLERHRTLEEFETAHVLFIARSETERLPQILGALEGRPILTVSDIAGFAEKGGMIGFVIVENRVRYEVNLNAARSVGLEISSKMLRLATAVTGEERE